MREKQLTYLPTKGTIELGGHILSHKSNSDTCPLYAHQEDQMKSGKRKREIFHSVATLGKKKKRERDSVITPIQFRDPECD